MSKEEVGDAVEQLKEIQTQIEELLAEAEGIVKECDYDEYNRAQAYWISHIKDALDGRLQMHTMGDTIETLKGLGE